MRFPFASLFQQSKAKAASQTKSKNNRRRRRLFFESLETRRMLTNSPPVVFDEEVTILHDRESYVNFYDVQDDHDSPDGILFEVVSGPSHGTIPTPSDLDGFLYFPDANFIGTDTFTYRARDNEMAWGNTATATIHVYDTAPVADDDSFATLHDQTWWDSVTGSDPDYDLYTADTVTFSIASEPSHGTILNFDPANGSYQYQPTTGYVGSDSFTFEASDGILTAQGTVTIDVWNTAPVAWDSSGGMMHDQSTSGTVYGSDDDYDVVTYSIANGPSHGTISSFDPVSGSYEYQPATGYVGSDSFTFEASDGIVADQGLVTFDVVNNAPLASSDSFSTLHDQPYSGSIYGWDDDYDLLTYSIVSGPSHGTIANFDPATGSYEYHPTEHYAGPDSFAFEVSDGIAIAQGTTTIDVYNTAPFANDDSFSILHDQPYSGSVYGWDLDSDILTYSIASGPSHGTISNFDPATGSYEYLPDELYAGSDSFTFEVSDGIAIQQGLVAIDVYNNAPTGNSDSYTTPTDGTRIITADEMSGVTSNDTDPDQPTVDNVLDAVLVSGPSHAQMFILNADGSFTYNPVPDYVGADSFTYIASDRIDASEPTTVTIDVINLPPDANDDTFELPADAPDILVFDVMANDSDPENEQITIIAVSSNTLGTTVWTDGQVIYYQLPSPTEFDWGGVVTLPNDDAESTAGVQETTDSGGFDDFSDDFTYTISDPTGAMSTASVFVQAQQQPSWSNALTTAFDSKGEIGIDGNPGYSIKILQVFGKGTRGIPARAGLQTWQTNTQTAKNIYVDTAGVVKVESGTDIVLADTQDIRRGSRTPLKITDTLGLKPGTTAATTLLITETVSKRLNFNVPGKLLPVPNKQPWHPNAQQIQTLGMMTGPSADLLSETTYVFVDKAKAIMMHDAGTLTNAQFEAIKSAVEAMELEWDEIPDKYERYSISDLGEWEYTP